MIVRDPPYEMVALFADLDAKLFFEELIERGQVQGCLRPFRWRSLRDSARDTVWRSPQVQLGPLHQGRCRLFLSWDLAGSGGEREGPGKLEERASAELERVGIPRTDVLATCFEPELEKVLVGVWGRVKDVVAEIRGESPPDDRRILARVRIGAGVRESGDGDLTALLPRAPKEVFEGLVAAVRLRSKADIFAKLGQRLSIPSLKGDDTVGRIAARLAEWFPGGSCGA